MGFLCCRNRKAWSLNFVLLLLSVRGILKTLTPSPWTPLRTWSITRPPAPPPPSPLRTPHKKARIKMTIIDLTHRLFFVSRWPNLHCDPVQILLWRWKEDLCTSKKTDALANLCFSLCIRWQRLPPPFCSAHWPARVHWLVPAGATI